MARRKSAGALPHSLTRAKVFVVANLVLWGLIGGWYLFQTPERKEDISRLFGNWAGGRKNVTAFEVAWDLWQIYGSEDFVGGAASGGEGPESRAHAYAGMPSGGRTVVRVLANEGYLVGYSETLGSPLWAVYRVRDVETGNAPKRPEEFRVDMRTAARVEPADYARSGYDRGHMAPNFAIATRYGKAAQEETFLMSNITPQKHALNAGPWKVLEQKIATSYAARFGEVWVIAGPVFAAKPQRLHRRVAVPDAFFMIIVDEREGQVRAEAFLFSQDTPEADDVGRHLVSIDDIEARTGLDFLSGLPDEAETVLESRSAARVW